MAGPWYIVVGGSEVDIDATYGTYTTGMVGFGMPPLTHNVYDQALTPGAILQNVKVKPRVLQLEIGCRGTTLAAYHSLRKLLVEACKPNYGGALTATELRYDGAGTKVKVFGYYDSGLQGQRAAGNKTPEVIALRFICYDPWFYAMATTTEALDSNATIANANYVIRRNSGVWANISTDFAAQVTTIGKDRAGNIYVGGTFSNVGDGDGDKIVKWNPATETLSSLSTGLNGTVSEITPSPDGGIYIGGAFTDAGDANGDRIVKWDGSAWSSIGTGVDNGTVRAIALGQNSYIFVGGTFINFTGASGDYMCARELPGNWVALGTGLDNYVYAMAVGPDNTLYVTGTFTTAGGATAAGIAKWDGIAWSAVGSGVGIAGSTAVGECLAVGPDGMLYVGGEFTSVDGVSASRIAKWNGTTWSALGAGLNNECISLSIADDGLLYAAGVFTTAGDLATPDRVAVWNGATWSRIDVNLPGTNAVYAILSTGDDLYIGYNDAGTAYGSGNTTITNSGTAAAYPTITIKRVGGTTARCEYLRNETTGETLYLNYSLHDGETLTITLTPGAKSIASDYFGNVIGRALLPNSDFAEWCLSPGANVVSLYVYEAGSPTVTASCAFVAAHWSVDGVAA